MRESRSPSHSDSHSRSHSHSHSYLGLLKHLLFWPVTGPMFLTRFSLTRVQGVVRDELTDDTRIKAELMELQLKLELGDIDEDEYVAQEAQLMQQLREVREWRERFGMGVSGGPVRVRSESDADEEADRTPDVADPMGGADIELNLDED